MPQPKIQDPRSLVVTRVPLSALHLDPTNARTLAEQNLAAIKAIVQRFGQAEPLAVHPRTGRVIGGNGRLVAMLALGWKECDVVMLELSDVEATALGIALNRTAELAGWDPGAPAKMLGELGAEGALDGVGYSSADIDELLAEIAANRSSPSVMIDPGPGEDAVKSICARGDVWRLGKLHRRVRAIEITPAFVDGTILRWQTMTGNAATLDGAGRTHNEISRERKEAS